MEKGKKTVPQMEWTPVSSSLLREGITKEVHSNDVALSVLGSLWLHHTV